MPHNKFDEVLIFSTLSFLYNLYFTLSLFSLSVFLFFCNMSLRQILTGRQFNEFTAFHSHKWVRLTNEKECHNGFQYKTGLNVDTNPFDPDTDCGDGLFFCLQEDCFRWAGDGKMQHIRPVTIPDSETELVVVDFQLHKAKAHQFVLGERSNPWTANFCKQVVLRDACFLRCLPLEMRTQDLCKLAVRQGGYACQYIPLTQWTDELCKLAVQQRSEVLLRHIPIERLIDKLCKLAIQHNGLALKHVPTEKCSEELCQLAVEQNSLALQYVPFDKKWTVIKKSLNLRFNQRTERTYEHL